jgi:[acyl-carrier-protein] S-malonyltransferase
LILAEGDTALKHAFVFPGQGSQSVGMLAALADAEPCVGATFAEASDVLGYDLWRLCQEGPEADLNATERTQPAMLAAGVAAWRSWRAHDGPPPALMAGHSLGEITALVCAEAVGFRDAVALVQFRGRAMQEAVPMGVGAMAAIIGLADAEVEAACAEAAEGEVVVAANYNSPGQVVIAGHAAAVTRAGEACKARGAARAVPLPVSGPFHSPLMKPAAERLRERLADVELRAPVRPVIAFDAGRHDSPEAIRDGLYRQLFNPVRWSAIMKSVIDAGVTHVVEAGPGKVLAGLARRAEGGRGLSVFALDGPDGLDKALEACKGEK